MQINNLITFLIKEKTTIITLAVIIAIAWILGQFIVPAVLKVIFL